MSVRRIPARYSVCTATVALVLGVLSAMLVTFPAVASPGSEPPAVPTVTIHTVPLATQPAGRDGDLGRTVRPGQPFSLVGLRWTGAPPDVAELRVRHGRQWGPWTSLEPAETAPGSGGATEPVWTGPADEVQVRAVRDGAPAADVDAVLIDPGRAATDAAPPVSRDRGIPVITRVAWGADESLRCTKPEYDDAVRAVALHHTAESNDYTREQAPAVVRAIYTYHARTLGWCDIGYNALVDRYGQVFEGRAGGLDRPVIAAHAGGFNRDTSGVAMMGSYGDVEPTPELVDALTAFLDWKFAVHHLDPEGRVTLTSEGGGTSRYAPGTTVTLPVLFGHRDVGATACPGDAGYALLPHLRSALAATAEPAAD